MEQEAEMTLRNWLRELFYDHKWHLYSEQVVDGRLVMKLKGSLKEEPEKQRVIKVSFVEEKQNEQ